MILKLHPVSGSIPKWAGLFLMRTKSDYDDDVIGPFRSTYSLSFIDQRIGGQGRTHTKKDLGTNFPSSFTGKDDGEGKSKVNYRPHLLLEEKKREIR